MNNEKMVPTCFDVTIRASLKSFEIKTPKEWTDIIERILWDCPEIRDVLMFPVQFSLNLNSYEPNCLMEDDKK